MTFLSIIPPIVILIFALLTRHVILSLLSGLFVAAFIVKEYHPLDAVIYAFQKLGDVLDVSAISNGRLSVDSNWKIFFFIAALGILIVLFQRSGMIAIFSQQVAKVANTPKKAQQATIFVSILFFIDDYFSSLSVGKIMSPITDRFKIARAKLAFIVDSMAAPLTILSPVSSWVGMIVGFLSNNGVSNDLKVGTLLHASPFSVFILTIPFLVYSWMIMTATWYIASCNISFGRMKQFEDDALNKNTTTIMSIHQQNNILRPTKFFDFIFVWGLVVLSMFFSFLYFGNWQFLGGHHTLVNALVNTSAINALFMFGWLSMCLGTFYLLVRRIIVFKELPSILWEGILLMMPAFSILTISWAVGMIIKTDLQIGNFLSQYIVSGLSFSFIPLGVFITAAITAFATGSSWGTAALFFPMVMALFLSANAASPMYIEDLPYLLPTLGALLSGCIAGDHVSPISDTTIMTAHSTEMPHIDHVQTQFTYAMPCIFFTGFAYFLIGISPNTFSMHFKLIFSFTTSLLGLFIFFNHKAKNLVLCPSAG